MFNQNTALSIVQDQSSEFKVDFDYLWEWCGYSTKGNAKKKLDKNFIQDEDFCIIQLDNTRADGGYSRSRQIISLTIDAAKSFAMMAQTDQGREVRRYFIEAEKQLRVNSSSLPVLSDLQEVKEISSLVCEEGISELEKQLRCRLLGSIRPQFSAVLEETKNQIAAASAKPFDGTMIPREIAKEMTRRKGGTKFSSNKINTLLEYAGFQTSVVSFKDKTKVNKDGSEEKVKVKVKKWKPTDLAFESNLAFESDITAPVDQKGNQYQGKQIRWHRDILDKLSSLL